MNDRTQERGAAFLLKVSEGDVANIGYSTVAGLKITTLSINGEPHAVNSRSGWRELLAGSSVRAVDIAASGIFTGSAGESLIRGHALAGSIQPYELSFAAIGSSRRAGSSPDRSRGSRSCSAIGMAARPCCPPGPLSKGQSMETHPLNAVDAARSEARVADIELGLSDRIDRSYWREKLEGRIRMLEQDQEDFGLVPHEELELRRLKALLGSELANG